jgi:uncharacterized glyoxalase superfamily protein PhnB
MIGDMADQAVFPALRYGDAAAAIEWLGRAFGAEPRSVHRSDDGGVQHAELAIEGNLVMLGEHGGDAWMGGSPPDARASTVTIYVVVDDPDAHRARAGEAGAEVVRELEDMDYGSREYSVRDLEGNLWSFGTYRPEAG